IDCRSGRVPDLDLHLGGAAALWRRGDRGKRAAAPPSPRRNPRGTGAARLAPRIYTDKHGRTRIGRTAGQGGPKTLPAALWQAVSVGRLLWRRAGAMWPGRHVAPGQHSREHVGCQLFRRVPALFVGNLLPPESSVTSGASRRGGLIIGEQGAVDERGHSED